MMAKLCGFSALRCGLTTLNIFYIVVGVFLIGLVVAVRTLAYFTNVPILVGIAVSGTLLIAVAILGLVGTIKHHQVMLFFYLIALFLSGIILFAVSVAVLAAPKSLQEKAAWKGLSNSDKEVIQSKLNCCGLNTESRNYTAEGVCAPEGHPRCNSTEEHLQVVVGVFLIGLVVAARTLAYFTNVPILVGIAVSGTLLIAVAILGLVGTIKHHQVMLFFYMIALFLSGIILFAVSVAVLAAPKSLQQQFFKTAWEGLSISDKEVIQSKLNCCGFNNQSRHYTAEGMCTADGHPRCNSTEEHALVSCCHDQDYTPMSLDPNNNCSRESICPECDPCFNSWDRAVSNAVLVAGSFGLIFSFTQVFGIVLTFWYRNQKDPNANPSAFL